MSGPAGDPLDEAGYATLVEEAFIAERGTPFLLSAKDWQLVRGWRESGVPADTVVRAIHETFERRRARGMAGKISSISYCASAVEERWEMERRGLVGQTSAAHPPAPGAREIADILAALGERLRAAAAAPINGIDGKILRKGLEAAAAKIDGIPSDGCFEATEERLSRIEASFVRAILRGLGSEPLAAVEARVADGLGDVKGVSGEVVDRMRRALTRREVRRLVGLPPLTLLEG
jgi:hypothetical protein